MKPLNKHCVPGWIKLPSILQSRLDCSHFDNPDLLSLRWIQKPQSSKREQPFSC